MPSRVGLGVKGSRPRLCDSLVPQGSVSEKWGLGVRLGMRHAAAPLRGDIAQNALCRVARGATLPQSE